MNIKKIVFILILCGSSLVSMAQNVTIVKCNTPSVNINGKELKAGAIFAANSKINWKSPKQVIIVRNASRKLVRVAASMSENGKSDVFNAVMMKSVKHLSSRATDDLPGGEYIIEDTLMVPSNLDADVDAKVEFVYEYKGQSVTCPVTLSKDKTFAIIERKAIKELQEGTVKGKLYGISKGDRFEMTDILEITAIDIAIKE